VRQFSIGALLISQSPLLASGRHLSSKADSKWVNAIIWYGVLFPRLFIAATAVSGNSPSGGSFPWRGAEAGALPGVFFVLELNATP